MVNTTIRLFLLCSILLIGSTMAFVVPSTHIQPFGLSRSKASFAIKGYTNIQGQKSSQPHGIGCSCISCANTGSKLRQLNKPPLTLKSASTSIEAADNGNENTEKKSFWASLKEQMPTKIESKKIVPLTIIFFLYVI